MYNIIQYMDFSKFKVSIITFIPEKKTTRIKDFQKYPLSIHQLAPETPLNPFALFTALKQEVKLINPDMLHAHCPRSLYLMCFLPRKYKRIYTIHIYPGLQQQILYGKFKGDIVNQLNHFFTRKVDLPIGCSESVGKLYKENKGWDISCIPNGSSLPIWNCDPIYRQKLRKDLGLKDDIRYFIFIGRFSGEKNPELLIRAFKQIGAKQVGLIMLGEGPLWEDLKKKVMTGFFYPVLKRMFMIT
ncbi:MAG: glycosyltransferase [Parabacteroides distasonis]|uniref:glycosyltransferase n=1 Tax=Parabacteroides distasonis TaxID=823 RepID=UPI002165AA2D|nr:glycosyltransferase [Parabacteroides distasonis]MCS2607185.1 glycosyltransferase [Parabacteroides distasonis]